MTPTIAMRDLMAAYNFGGQSAPADELIGRKINVAKRRATFGRRPVSSAAKRCRLGSGTETFSTRCVTPSWHRTGSKTFGAIRQPFPLIVYDASFGR
jgi:hypothetical protein